MKPASGERSLLKQSYSSSRSAMDEVSLYNHRGRIFA